MNTAVGRPISNMRAMRSRVACGTARIDTDGEEVLVDELRDVVEAVALEIFDHRDRSRSNSARSAAGRGST